MSKAGERLIDGMKEALAVARGEQPATRIHINGHGYVPEQGDRQAVERVIAYLTREFIVEECVGNLTEGCVSCEMIEARASVLGRGFASCPRLASERLGVMSSLSLGQAGFFTKGMAGTRAISGCLAFAFHGSDYATTPPLPHHRRA